MLQEIVWILQKDFDGQFELKDEITRQGQKYIEVPKFFNSEELDDYLNEQVVIACGPINMCQEIHKISLFPGTYCDLNMFKCCVYYPYCYKYLLNQDCEFIPFGLLKLSEEKIYERHGVDNCIFIRPDTGGKSFIGFVLEKERFKIDLDSLRVYPEELVIVSSPKVIHRESRIVMVDGKAVTGSTYRIDGKIEHCRLDSTSPLFSLAEKISEKYRPESCFTLDIAEGLDYTSLVEINSFSSSGLYSCDLEIVVREVSQQAVKDWHDVYG